MSGTSFRRRMIRGIFRAWSGSYDASLLQPILYRPTHAAVMRAVEALPAPDRALDMGCGTARLTADLAARFPKARVSGVDLSPGMLEAARRRLGNAAMPLVVGDAYAMPFRSGSQALVTSTIAWHWLLDAPAALAEVHRVLRPGGHFVLGTVYTRWFPGRYFRLRYVTESIHRNEFAAAGFTVLGREAVGHRVLVFVARA